VTGTEPKPKPRILVSRDGVQLLCRNNASINAHVKLKTGSNTLTRDRPDPVKIADLLPGVQWGEGLSPSVPGHYSNGRYLIFDFNPNPNPNPLWALFVGIASIRIASRYRLPPRRKKRSGERARPLPTIFLLFDLKTEQIGAVFMLYLTEENCVKVKTQLGIVSSCLILASVTPIDGRNITVYNHGNTRSFIHHNQW